ncbi:MAG TPA: hypothetical protein VHE30_08880 [Polyangiaceae bacterium]|nr:hypothetical protein [Polyangiaceae bacterium]
MLSRRSVLTGGLATAAHLALSRRAGATVARALTLNQLVHQSRHGFVGTPVDAFCRWETIGGHSRIVTYTLVRADYSFDGRPPATSDVMVRTLGGAVDDVGQVVPGEAVLDRGVATAVFLEEATRDLFVVTGMSQGSYPVRLERDGVKRLRARASQLEIVGASLESAVRRLDGRSVTETEALVAKELASGPR